jgi:molybdopterin-guanine dinucleotide biosynthesis protein A
MIDGLLVLAGGHGRRLGMPKAWIEWDGQPLLLRILDRLAPLAPEPPIVVAQPGQELPDGNYQRADDQIADSGPLAGLAVGLNKHANNKPDARIAVVGCDYPFADPRVFKALAELAPDAVAILPRWGSRTHPLHAIWSAKLWVECDRAVAAGQLAVHALLQRVPHRVIDAAEIDALTDPERVLLNLNDRDDLKRARAFS